MTSIVNKSSVAKIAAVIVGVAFLFSLAVPAHAALTEAQIQSILSLLQSFGADASTVANVDSSLRGTTPSAPSSSSSAACTFTQSLTVGAKNAEVTCLQNYLIGAGFSIPAGATGFFGSQTQSAVAAWQAANGVTPAVGYFGPLSQAKYLQVAGSTTSTPTGPGPVVTVPGTGLVVASATQPQNSLAPQNASRLPFTNFTLTAGSDGDVTVNGVVVKRTGPGSNAAFDGVVLLDQAGNQLGEDKTLNSNDQATIGGTFTIPKGQTRAFTVAGNMAASLSGQAGEVPAFSVIAINTSAAVSGSLPITGAFHTVNFTLTIGTLSLDISSAFASNTPLEKEIGTTQYKVLGFRMTAGSAEDVLLKTLTFNQTGSASTHNDIANIQVVVGGTTFPVTISADGKYVTANLGAGLLLKEGDNVEAYLTYDIVGSNSNNRTVTFDVDENTDIYGIGQTFGYGISPAVGTTAVSTLTDGTSNTTETSGTPYIFGNQVTINGASVTTIAKAASVPAQNIAVNVPNQPLGGFVVDIKGEPITVQKVIFTVATTSGSGTGLLTNVTIVDENGTVIAGPVDATGAGTSLTFTDSITFKTGNHIFTLRGKVHSSIGDNTVYTISTTPSSQWTNVKGELTGDTITISQGAFSMNAMTVEAASLAISRSSSPASQNIVAGGTSVLMLNFQLDATQSGEDVRLSSFPAIIDGNGGTTNLEGDYDFLSSCQLFDGSLALNTGSNVINPTGTATGTTDFTGTFTFDNSITIAKGSVKTLGLRCTVSGSTPSNSEFVWDHNQTASNFSSTGVASGNAITETFASDANIVVTVSAGSTTVATDASSPGYKLVSGGTTDVVIAAYRFRATNEALNLQKLGLSLTNTASSAPGDLVKVSVYDGVTKLGEAFFTGNTTEATSTFSQSVTLPKDQDKTLTVKADLATIGVSQSATFSGHLVAVDYLNAEGVGVESGTTQRIGAGAGSTAVAGIRVMKSFPTVAKSSLPSTGIADGRLMRFSVTADAKGPIGVTELNFTFSTTTATLSNVQVFVYDDVNFSNASSGLASGGAFNNNLSNSLAAWASGTTNFEFTAHNTTASSTLQIPAGGTRYFEVRGTVTGSTSGASITSTLRGASAFITGTTPTAATTNPLAKATSANFGNDFIWSPNSTTTAVRADLDWTGAFNLAGLPANGLIETRSN